MPVALLVVDVQRAREDVGPWRPTGRRDNPGCGANVARSIGAWRARREPVVVVRHEELATIVGTEDLV